ncbi:hypothetical protein G6F57_016812 [Rhizopus arrhizus]|uniref:Uncharacterized protein n=1 Tax=Rhizopus oryzae TaxID=64495 RepID=A0A9P6WWH1_RHIOR|nr:hypothetical protein G6F23_013000 [Rhizopus arrhizus]KAG1392042.1 hypothetical protein G6F58_012594 [Rhizopus delemar]KAG0752540.1 hypothetical protein G6F24_013515 [Rhizopus arrhizus]KAG0774869.1 hypothetical protein G6F22_013729 [Rhizopus arrhizus]KAG0778312.1 hypothetical protein G6F21_013039 [Rhizopus arrhizus]
MSPDLADSNTPPPLIIETVYWGVSRTPAFYQLQDYVGLVVHKSGSNRYLEVNFDKDEFRTALVLMAFNSMMGELSYALHLLVDRA